ncbi:MAG: flagellar basal body P-ring formation protein FlgA [Candidatus Delongbacteria bacterium]|nr:flagellar basal body P-ring formation protein FlgA [Candidatus Delongbacteria bacterium]MBN2833349.1 flagellar basal body P-ring formation protein FlgA [Candidatus Delongbacteria bacterium]
MKISIMLIFSIFFAISGKDYTINGEIYSHSKIITAWDLFSEKPDFENFEVTKSPLGNFEKKIDKTYIKNILTKNGIVNFNLIAPEQIIIKNKIAVLSKQQIEECVNSFVKSKWAGCENYSVIIKDDLENIEYPDWDNTLIYPETSNFDSFGGHYTIFIKIESENNLIKKIPVNILINTMEKVLMTKQKISKGDVLNESMFNKVEVETTGEKNLFNLGDNLHEYYAAKVIAPGEYLKNYMTKKIPDIKRNDIVNFTLQDGKITLEMEAKALKDCYIGENARFKITDTGKILRAVVTGSNSCLYTVSD